MSKPHIFVSCGQRTIEEKLLGEAICKVIRDHGVFDCFFAEAQHNLNGLHENILDALAKSDGFITVMHRRGNVHYGPDHHEPLHRCSVWIEQEIAIAAYIQRTAKRDLFTAAYIEKGVGLEGLRVLLHLNPMPFTSNEEVVADVKSKLITWHKFSTNDNSAELRLRVSPDYEGGVLVKKLTPILTYKGSRANEYACTLEIPELLLSFNTAFNVCEVQRRQPGYRRFQATERTKQGQPLLRDNPVEMLTQGVAIAHLSNEQKEQVLKQSVQASADIGDRVYTLTRSCVGIFPETQPAMGEEIAGPDSNFGYFYFNSKPYQPLCPKCYQSLPSKTVYMGPRIQRGAGGVVRACPVCDFRVIEQKSRNDNMSLNYDPYENGPDGWMR